MSEAKKVRQQDLALPIKIAGHDIPPGGRLQFNLPAGSLYTHAPLDLPVEIIHGRRAGPVLLVCAAIHGDELNGVEIIRRLRSLKILNRLRGTLIMVPVVNLFGFIHQSRYLPDRRDLNRCFPGSEHGSIASRIASIFFNSLVVHCTHIIDLHTGAVHRENLPQIRATLKEPGVRKMAMDFSIPVIIDSSPIDSSLRKEVGKLNIPILTLEAGEALRLSEQCVVTGVRGIVNVMRGLHMLPPKRSEIARIEPFIAKSSSWFRAPLDGLFRPVVRLGTLVSRGDTLGVISAPFSSDESILVAKSRGIVICVNNLPLVNEGEALFHIAQFRKSTAVEKGISDHESQIERDRLYGVESIDPVDT